MNFLSKKTTIRFTLAVVLSSFQIMTIATSSKANPYGDAARQTEREADILIDRGRRENQQIIDRLSCDQLLTRAEAKRRNFEKWQEIARNSTTEYNRRASLNSAKGSLEAVRQYMNVYTRKGC